MNSQTIEIRVADFSYAAHVGRGLIERAGALSREVVRGHRAAIICDTNIPGALIQHVVESFAAADFQTTSITIPPGEKSKSLGEVERVCDEMSSLDRSSVVVGVGGGVVGDLSGFVAAIFHRGISHVQIPTTLLAMVDSSIGGKTAVNLAAGKNLVGAMHHPALVIADPDVLETLPARELRQGYAEMVKHAIIADAEMFSELSRDAKQPSSRSSRAELFSLLSSRAEHSGVEGSRGSQLQGCAAGSLGSARDDRLIARDDTWIARDDGLIARNIKIKAAIVSADDCDLSGERAVLNFGHTVGHAIEQASDFRIAHGDCVSLGMVAACEISIKYAGLAVTQRDQVIDLLRRLQLPTRLPPDVSREKIAEALSRDKKFEDGKVRFVVTPEIGKAFLSRDVTLKDIEQAISLL